MSFLLAIDPGKDTGYAYFSMAGGELLRAGLCGNNLHELAGLLRLKPPGVTRLVIELPEVYAASHSKGNPNDLVPLAVQAGDCRGIAYMLGVLPHQINLVLPKHWKGQVPKEVLARRERLTMTPGEISCVTIQGPKAHNVWDAVCLGRYELRRLKVRK